VGALLGHESHVLDDVRRTSLYGRATTILRPAYPAARLTFAAYNSPVDAVCGQSRLPMGRTHRLKPMLS